MNTFQKDCIGIITDHYPYEQQREIFVEECAEAIQAVQKCKRQSGVIDAVSAYENLKEEVADVIITAAQMRHYLGEDAIDKLITSKLVRQIERIAQENDS